MARVWLLLSLLLSTHLAHLHQVKRLPEDGSVAGVFQLSQLKEGRSTELIYSFNVSVAREVCLQRGVAMATKVQVEQARRHGLQTCRYGWVDEQIVVIPRVEASPACGQNNTGLVLWRVPVGKHFDVFCFNQTDLELQLLATTTTTQPLRTRTAPRPSSSPPLLLSSPPGSPVEEALSSRQIGVGEVPTVLLITAVCVLLLLGFTSLWFIRRKGSCCPLLAGGAHCQPSKTELKEACVVPLTFTQSEHTSPTSNQSEHTSPASTQSEHTSPTSTQSEHTSPTSTQSEEAP
ncbi:lymphatic vessel endothelial hyaluronic acid receptor 1a [Clupea harengus]|uniref:Lymphatic vessel endothelial hyaluronic acid receptor 1a n=1 Tax=Clupea harengus TaxID=7950 RepID=A0A6P8ESI0_CLUHA|nr:lymphatic vessel endothelial hyaluronic acid receptor 1a [Clupea harengus]XP_042558694.1 lymphatic vessel endothelial hyaluronic acid receptor 1a [Clupea harengus]